MHRNQRRSGNGLAPRARGPSLIPPSIVYNGRSVVPKKKRRPRQLPPPVRKTTTPPSTKTQQSPSQKNKREEKKKEDVVIDKKGVEEGRKEEEDNEEELSLFLYVDENGNEYYGDENGKRVDIPDGYMIEVGNEKDNNTNHEDKRPDPPSRTPSPPPPSPIKKQKQQEHPKRSRQRHQQVQKQSRPKPKVQQHQSPDLSGMRLKTMEELVPSSSPPLESSSSSSSSLFSNKIVSSPPPSTAPKTTSSSSDATKDGSFIESLIHYMTDHIGRIGSSPETMSIVSSCLSSQILLHRLSAFHRCNMEGKTMMHGSLVIAPSFTVRDMMKGKPKTSSGDVYMLHLVDFLNEFISSTSIEAREEDFISGLNQQVNTNMAALLKMHGIRNCKGVLWMPNASKLHKRSPPTGFAFAMDASNNANIRLNTELLNSTKIGYGSFAVRIDPTLVATENRMWISKEEQGNPLAATGKGMSLHDMLRSAPGEAYINKLMVNSPELDSFRRNELKPGRGAYISICATQNRSNQWNPEIWIVVQCGNEAKSQEYYRIIQEECSKDQANELRMRESKANNNNNNKRTQIGYSTWANTLYSKKKTKLVETMAEISNTRADAAVCLLHALGFTQVTRSDLLSMPNIDNPTNFFGFDDETESYVYYAGCTSIRSNHKHPEAKLTVQKPHSAVIVQENPFSGPVILKGPPLFSRGAHQSKRKETRGSSSSSFRKGKKNINEANILGGVWRPVTGLFRAFPCVTGRKKPLKNRTPSEVKKMIGDGEYKKNLGFVYTWVGQKNKNDYHPRLENWVYRTRGQSWMSLERAIGWDPSYGTIELKPLHVLMAPPPTRSLFENYGI